MTLTDNWHQTISFVWSVKEVLRDHYKRHQYGEVILPMVVLRRLDDTLSARSSRDPSTTIKQAVLARAASLKPPHDLHQDLLGHVAGLDFYNTSKYDLQTLLGDEHSVAENFSEYLSSFSPNVREIVQAFDFQSQVEKMSRAGILYSVLGLFASPQLDLAPDKVSNLDMGYIYEEIIRGVAELANEEAGEHFTPREVIDLMTSLLVADDPSLHRAGKVVTVYDPTCGTGGMLTVAEARLLSVNKRLKVHLRGQEVQEESFAVCRSDMLIRGERTSDIRREDTLAADQFPGQHFDYTIANPPYGKDWKQIEKAVKAEHARGEAGRFPAGLPATSDGQLLFLQHMVSKMKPVDDGGGRSTIVMNGGPLFNGDAGSGPSRVREHLINRDLVEAVIALPTDLFYNTNITTYVWVLTNKKAPEREGYVQLIDARGLYSKMPKSLGNKRNELSPEHLRTVIETHDSFTESEISKILPNDAFGYTQVTVERPLRVSYRVTETTADELATERALGGLPAESLARLRTNAAGRVGWASTNHDDAASVVGALFTGIGKPTAPARAAALKALTIRDPHGEIVTDVACRPVADPQLRDTENVPLLEDVDDFFAREVLAHRPDAWMDRTKDRLGYEIPFTRIFFRYEPPRPLDVIDKEMREVQDRVLALMSEVAE